MNIVIFFIKRLYSCLYYPLIILLNLFFGTYYQAVIHDS